MTELKVNGNLVMLQPGSSQLFSEDESIMKFEVEQSPFNSPSLTVFHYHLKGGVDMASYTTTNPLFNAEIKMLQLRFIFFEYVFSNQKDCGSSLYRAVASHIILFCLNDVWTDSFLPGKEP